MSAAVITPVTEEPVRNELAELQVSFEVKRFLDWCENVIIDWLTAWFIDYGTSVGLTGGIFIGTSN